MDDATIVQMYWDRDEQAIQATADKYGDYCIAIAKHILVIHEDAQECVNDTYLKAWSAIPPKRPSMLATFLGKITRNLAINRYKYMRAYKRGYGEVPLVLDELAECVSGNCDVEQEYDYKELIAAINEFLSTLSTEKRSIFVCRYWYTQSIEEIGARCGMTCGAITMTLSRIRKQLRRYLVERGFDL